MNLKDQKYSYVVIITYPFCTNISLIDLFWLLIFNVKSVVKSSSSDISLIFALKLMVIILFTSFVTNPLSNIGASKFSMILSLKLSTGLLFPSTILLDEIFDLV